MSSNEDCQWEAPGMNHVINESAQHHRRTAHNSVIQLARAIKRSTSAANTAPPHQTESKKVTDGRPEAKSVAAVQRDGLALQLACMNGRYHQLETLVETLQASLHKAQEEASEKARSGCEHSCEQRITELSSALNAARIDLEAASSAIGDLERERENTSQRLTTEIAARKTAEERAAINKAKLQQMLEDARLDAAHEIKTLGDELRQAHLNENKLESQIAQYDVEQKKTDVAMSELRSERSELSTKLDKSANRIEVLEKQTQHLQEEIRTLRRSGEQHKSTYSDLVARNQQLDSALTDARAEQSRVQNELLRVAKESGELSAALKQANSDLHGATEQLEAEKSAHATTRATLAAASENESKLQATLSRNQAAMDSTSKELTEARKQLAKATNANEQVHKAVIGQSEKVSLQQKIIAELQGENASLKAWRQQTAKTYKQEHTRLVELVKEASEAKRKCRVLEAYQKQDEQEVTRLTEENKQLSEERLELAQGLERELRRREALETKLNDVQFNESELLSALEEQQRKYMQQIVTHSKELHAKQEEAAVLEQELKRVTEAQLQHSSDAKGVELLHNELFQKEHQLRNERKKARRLQNQIQDLKGNIRVVVRVRPSMSSALSNLHLSSESVGITDIQNTCKGTREVVKKFYFDRVLGPEVTNRDVCEETEYIVQSALDGQNVCILAYGQTGSGKTWTMGSADGVSMWAMDAVMEAAQESHSASYRFEYSITVESVEIYNEQLRDLLDDSPMLTDPASGLTTGAISRYGRPSMYAGSSREGSSVALKMNERTRLPELVGTTKVAVTSALHARELFTKAARARSVASTAANQRSSRSHFIFIVHIERRHKQATNSEVQHGVLNLVDLAGSERLAHSKTTGERLVETTAINSSLSTLGTVIKTLASREQRAGGSKAPEHLTYRDSKLTFLLQGSLSGNAKTMLLATLSPEADHASETRSTLQFAETASKATVARGGPEAITRSNVSKLVGANRNETAPRGTNKSN